MNPIAPLFLKPESGHWQPSNRLEAELLAAIQPVLNEYGVTFRIVRGHRRRPFLVRARWACVLAAHQAIPQTSLSELGRFFNRDHSAIFYALKKSKSLTLL